MAARPVVIVTGAARGIGRGICDHLMAQGWHVVGVDVPKSGIARQKRAQFVPLEGDVSDELTAKRAVKTTLDRFGRLNAIVSNAGIMIRKPIRQLTLTEWHRVIDVNLTATFLLARAAEKPLRKAKGAIVTIASTRALMSEPDTESYSASKGGIVALTHALSISLTPDVRSIASVPAGSMSGNRARCAQKITSSIRPDASESPTTSPKSSASCSTESDPASSPARISLSTAA